MHRTLKKGRTIRKLPDFPTIEKGKTRESGTLYQMEMDNWKQQVFEYLRYVELSKVSHESVVLILKEFGFVYWGDEQTLRKRLENMLHFIPVLRWRVDGARWDEFDHMTFQNVQDQEDLCGMLLRQEDVCNLIFKSLDAEELIACLRVCKRFYLYAHPVLCKKAQIDFGVFGTPICYSLTDESWACWESFGYLDHLNNHFRACKEKRRDFNAFLADNGCSYFKINNDNGIEADFFFPFFFKEEFCKYLAQFYHIYTAWDANFLKNLMERTYNQGQKIPLSHCGPFFSGLVYLSEYDSTLFNHYCGKKFTKPKEFPLGDDVFAVFFEKKLSFVKVCSEDENVCKVRILEQIKGNKKHIKKINMQKGYRFAIVTKY